MTSTPMQDLIAQSSGDPRVRQDLGQRILDAIRSDQLDNDSLTLSPFMDLIVQWMNGANFKAIKILIIIRGIIPD